MAIPKILVVDDDEFIVEMIKTYFRHKGFEVTSASNGREALKKEEKHRPDVIIMDIDMPLMNGFETSSEIRKKRSGPDYVPIVFLSGNLKEENVLKAFQSGADDFVHKPFKVIELSSRISNLLKLKKLLAQLESMENVIFSLVKSIEARDSYTATHSQRVADISVSIAREMKLQEFEVEILHKGAILHDIGKIGVPDSILNKKGRLMQDETDTIKEHPEKGAEICRNLRLKPLVIDIIMHHHEDLDGGGYPDRLNESKIDKLVRIVSIADRFDALTTNRPYRSAMKRNDAIGILKKDAINNKLDMNILACLEKITAKKTDN